LHGKTTFFHFLCGGGKQGLATLPYDLLAMKSPDFGEHWLIAGDEVLRTVGLHKPTVHTH